MLEGPEIMKVVGHVLCSLAAKGADDIPCGASVAKRAPYTVATPILRCQFATYFSDVQHIQAWLSSKGTP